MYEIVLIIVLDGKYITTAQKVYLREKSTALPWIQMTVNYV